MKTTIIIGDDKNFSELKNSSDGRRFFHTMSEPEALLYHIENPEVDSYIILADHFTENGILSLIQHIHYLNSIISVLILHGNNLNANQFADIKNVTLCRNTGELASRLHSLPMVHRDTNRTEWPVKVVFWRPGEERQRRIGNILSISSGGCFIRTDIAYKHEEILLMTINFRDFDLFTEGLIVRQSSGNSHFQPEGLAIQFQRTSPQTQKCIQRIIDEKILGDLMKKLNPEERSRE